MKLMRAALAICRENIEEAEVGNRCKVYRHDVSMEYFFCSQRLLARFALDSCFNVNAARCKAAIRHDPYESAIRNKK